MPHEDYEHLPRDTPYKIDGISLSMFSVARYYGGCVYNGQHYTYDPTTDTLIRDDVLKAEQAAKRQAAKPNRRKRP